MSTKDYVKVLRSVLKMQVQYTKENHNWEEEFYEGMVRGLEIAIHKIDNSTFLYVEEN